MLRRKSRRGDENEDAGERREALFHPRDGGWGWAESTAGMLGSGGA